MNSGAIQTMQYPQSLRKLYDCVGDDVNLHNKRLLERSSTLFTEANNVSVDVMQFSRDEGTKRSTIAKSEDLDQHLSPLSNDIGHRLFILKPSRKNNISECPLHISEIMAQKLLAAFEIFPFFVNFMHAFGSKPDLTFGGCKHKLYFLTLQQSSAAWDLSKPPSGYEICYNFKSAIRRPGKPPNNWSIRQTAVYQKFTYDKRQSVWVLVQPEESVRKRVEQSFESHTRHLPKDSHWNPLELHLIYISAAAENWGAYFNDLEMEFLERTTNAVEIKVGAQLDDDDDSTMVGGAGDPRDDFVVEFHCIQRLQRFEETVQRFRSSLEINEDTIRSLQTMNTNLRDFGSDPAAKLTWHCVDTALEQQLADIARHKRDVDGLLRKIQGRGRLLYNVLEYQTAFQVAKLAQDREQEREITRLERKETTAKKIAMSEKTVRDTVGVKIMTIVALLYLPSTFVATFLDAGIISFSNDDKSSTSLVNFKRLQYSSESLIFFFCTSIPLTFVTIGIWYFFERRNRNRKGDEENTLNSNTLNVPPSPPPSPPR